MKKTILLLASDPAIRGVIARTLESVGYFVLTAGNLGAAIELLKVCVPDLFILRHFIEDVSGHEAAIYLRSKFPGVPILLLGGIPADPDLEERELVSGLEVFPRPFQPSELLDKVREILLRGIPFERKKSTEF